MCFITFKPSKAPMRHFVVFFFCLITSSVFSQETPLNPVKVSATVIDDNTLTPIINANIININTVKGATSNEKGIFEIDARVNDTLHITLIGYQSLKIKVTNDWIKTKQSEIRLTQKAYALEEVIVGKYMLTGYLEVDAKLIPVTENYRYSISGLEQGYEAGENSPNAFSRVMGSLFNPADALYNFFGNKPKELKKLKEMKKDDTVKNLLESKFDREMISVLLGIDKKDIPDILTKCNYSEAFIKTANDLQILEAISNCYEEYKVLKRK
jgi:hypothetical protein